MANSTAVKTLLAADIGGTHSRFALFSLDLSVQDPSKSLALLRSVRFGTQTATSTESLMRILADTGLFSATCSSDAVRVDAAVFAIPGPTSLADVSSPPMKGEVCYCPNIEWRMESAVISAALGGIPVRLINDFVANGFACALLSEIVDAVSVLPGEAGPEFPRAVVGGGTGLGHCLILPGEKPAVMGAEGGHAVFPFTGDEEDIARHFRSFLGTERPDGDDVVTGNGLVTLYAYFTGEKLHPNEVPPLAAEHPEMLSVMARFYGRAVCHYVVNTLALGGVFITGGLAANLPQVLAHSEFAAELRERSPMRHILADIPVWHVRNQDVGLWGAAACASFLVE